MEQAELIPADAKRKGKALAAVEAPAVPAVDPAVSMLQRIMTDPSVSIERVTQAFDFYERVQASQARKDFESDLAKAKSEFKPIKKTHKVEFEKKDAQKTRYFHEDLSDIDAATDEALAKYGFTTRYRTSSRPNEPVSVTFVLAHKSGHVEENTLTAGADSSGGKNSIQGIGSTITYLQRYAKKAGLGLAAARDDDAMTAEDPVELSDAQALFDKAGSDDVRARLYRLYKIEGFHELPKNKFQHAFDLMEMMGRK